MKNLNFLSNLCGLGRALQSSDVGSRCRVVADLLPSFCRVNHVLTLLVVMLFTIGVGNVWGTHTVVKAGDMVSGEKYIITAVYNSTTYYLAPASFDYGGGTATAYTTSLTEAAAWTFTKSSSSWTITTKIGNTTYYLNNKNANNGVRSSANSQTWTVAATTSGASTVYITGGNSRKLALYQSSNWRCYSTTSGVQTITLYKVGSSCTEITPTLSYTSTNLTIGGGNSSSPTLNKDGSTGTVTWTSSNPSVATVNSSGVVSPVGTGTCNITATIAEAGGKCGGSVSVEFTVTRTINYYVGSTAYTVGGIDGETLVSTLPESPTSCDLVNYPHFYGWKNGSLPSSTTTPPAILSTETVSSSSAANTYYAVFTDVVPSSPWEQITSLSASNVGDEVVFVYDGATKYEMTGVASNLGTATERDEIPDDIAGTFTMTIEKGYDNTGYSFKNGTKYIAHNADKKIELSATKNALSSWTPSGSSGNFKLQNNSATTYSLQYNVGSPRWTDYTSSQGAFQIYKRGAGGTVNYVTSCVATHTVTPAVSPAGKATVTLGATTVAEDATTTAEYSGITTGYEFVNWTITGTGASLSSTTTNPTTITMGTANVTVTANLRCITPTFSAHPSNVTCNQGASPSLSVTAAAGGASLNYQWMQCATADGVYSNVASGGNSSSYSPSTASLGTMYYKCKVTNAASGCSANATSNAASVTVTATVTYAAGGAASGSVPSSHTGLASGDVITLRNPSTGGGSHGSLVAPTGKQFAGWDDGNDTYAAGADYTVTGNATMTATWSCITPSISVQPAVTTNYTQDDTPTPLSVTASGGTLSYQWKQCATIDGVYSNVASGGTSSTYSPSTASVGTIYYKCVVTNTGSSCNTTVTSDAAAITVNAASYFTNGATVFIQTGSVSSAWDDNSCVKAWFNASGAGGAAQTTYWLYDGTGDNNGKKLFATIVPASGDLNQVTLQRFASNCSDFWNNNGTLTKASDGGSNTFRTEGPGTSAVAWNASGVVLNLHGDPSGDAWASSLATFSDQGNGVWGATYNNYAPANAAGESQDFKIKTSYNDWIGNTGNNDNATLSGMHVGSTYNITATLDVKDHSLEMSKTFVKGTVHYDIQDHGSAIADVTDVNAGSKISAPSAPSETGWTFGGWYKEPACTNAWNFASDVVNETMTLYAKWTIKTTTVSFNQNGGSGGQTSSKTATYGSAMPTPITCPTRTGYDFGGYYDGAGGTGTQYYTNAGASARTWNKEDATWTLYAKWTAKEYSVTLDREGASTGSASVTMTYNSASHTAITAPSKTGYTFGGWYTGDDGTGTQVMNASGVLQAGVSGYTGAGGVWTKTTTPTTLYAKWTANPYTVTLNDGSGSGGDGTVPVTYNSNTNISDVTKPTYAGNDFRGYYTAAGGTGTKVINGNGEWIRGTSYVDASGNWVNAGNVTLIAHYTATTYENYRVSCSATAKTITINQLTHGTVTTSPSGTAEPGDDVTITLTPDAHYNAGGAPTVIDENDDPVTVSGSGTTYTFTMPDADVTITPAAWSPINVTIYWHRKTGTTQEAVLEGTTGKTFPNTTDVDAECAPFLGWIAGESWADSPDKPATYYEYGDDMPGPINANVHYTAIYGEIEMHETSAYVKVTSAPSNWSGDYLIVRDDNSRAFDGSLSTLDAANNYIGVTITAGTIVANSTVNASKWTIAKVGETSNYTIKSASGYYIGRTSNSNGLNSSTSEEYTNTLAYSTDHVDITSSAGPKLQMNSGTRFRYYGTSQQVLQLYKLGIAEVPTTTYTKNPACTPKYHVTVNSAVGGSPSSDKTLEPEGETITLTANPGAGYSFTSWAMENSSTHADATSLLSSSTATTATFSMPAYDVTVTATYAKKMVSTLEVKDGATVISTTTGPVSGTVNVSTGANKTLDVVVTPSDAFDHSWTATVSAGGTYASITNVTAEGFRVNGLAQGDATITVNAPNDGSAKSVTLTVHVTDIMPEEIILKREGSDTPIETLVMYYDASASQGQYVKVNVGYSPANPTNKVFTFESANTGKVGSHSHAPASGYEALVAKGVTTDPVNCTFTSAADGSVTKVLAVTVLPILEDRFVDYVHGNATQTVSARLSVDRFSIITDINTPSLSDASDADPTSEDCETAHYHLIGWLPQTTAEALMAAGTPITEATEGLVRAGVQVEATGQTWCAIWAEEAE